MGALHRGHFALLQKAREIAGPQGRVIASIFINPIQFDRPEDLAAYPRTWENDCALCQEAGVDVIFAPHPEHMYAPDHSIKVTESQLSRFLCGSSRPGHFDGVCTVVLKLFCLFLPDVAIFGEKDFQQLAIIQRLVRDLNFPIEILPHPTIRDADGLALSSRNQRLSAQHRADAPRLFRALTEAAALPSPEKILTHARHEIQASPFAKIDYLSLIDQTTLEPADSLEKPTILAVAAFYDTARLIDHVRIPAQPQASRP